VKKTYRERISLALFTFLPNISNVVIHVQMIGFGYFQIDSKDTSWKNTVIHRLMIINKYNNTLFRNEFTRREKIQYLIVI
jgi:hypothetical protein